MIGIGIASAVTLDAGTVLVLDDINITLANNLTFDEWIEVGSNYTAYNDSGWTSNWTIDSDNHLTGTLDEWTMDSGSEQYIYSILSSGLLTDYDQTIKVEDNESYYLLFKDGSLDSVLDTDANGNISFSELDTIPTTTEFEIEKERPNLISPTNGSSETYEYPPLTNRIEFDWTDSGAPAWNIQVSKTVGFTVLAVDAYVSTNNSSYNLPVGYDYWWRVRSYYEDDDFTGNWTESWQFEINSTTTLETNATVIHGVVQTAGNSPISSATVTIYNSTFSDSMVTGSNGYYIFDELTGGETYYIQATRDGYEASSILSVTAINNTVVTKNIILQEENAPTYITPHYVRFVVQDIFGNYYDDVTVNVYIGDSATVSYTGTTGDDGAVGFELSETVQYRLTFVSVADGIDDELYIYPKKDEYVIYITTSIFPSDTNTEADDIDITITKSNINSSHAYINVTYDDALSETSNLMFYLNQSQDGQPRNQTIIDSYNAGDVSSITHSFIVVDYTGETYILNIYADHDTYGDITYSYYVRFAGMEEDYGFSEVWIWIGVSAIMFVGMMFKPTKAIHGAVVIAAVGWLVVFMGWFDNLGTQSLLSIEAGLTLATVLALSANMAKQSRQEQMKSSYAIILFIFIFSLLSTTVNDLGMFDQSAIETGITSAEIEQVNSSAMNSTTVNPLEPEDGIISIFTGAQMVINAVGILIVSIGKTLIILPTLLKYNIPLPIATLFQVIVTYIEATAIGEFISGRRITK